MQALEDKCEAIKSLLPLLYAHLCLLPMAGKVTRYQTVTVDPSEPPPPVWLGLDCDGLCLRCEWGRECGGDAWEVAEKMLAKKYRLSAVAAALARLSNAAPQLAEAVRCVYVEPWCGRPELKRWADAGVRWMARKIRGDIMPAWERPKPKAEQIAELAARGLPALVIARRVGCSEGYVRRIRRAIGERSERVLSAVGVAI